MQNGDLKKITFEIVKTGPVPGPCVSNRYKGLALDLSLPDAIDSLGHCCLSVIRSEVTCTQSRPYSHSIQRFAVSIIFLFIHYIGKI